SDPFGEDVEVLVLDARGFAGSFLEHLGVSELLPQLGGEPKVIGNFGRPRFGGVLVGRSIEGTVDLDRAEELRVEAELVFVSYLGRIERPVPGPSAFGVPPA